MLSPSIGHCYFKLPFHIPFFGRLVSQAGRISAEDTPKLKLVRVSALGCESTIDNDIPGSWDVCYLYYLNGPLLVDRIRGLVHG